MKGSGACACVYVLAAVIVIVFGTLFCLVDDVIGGSLVAYGGDDVIITPLDLSSLPKFSFVMFSYRVFSLFRGPFYVH